MCPTRIGHQSTEGEKRLDEELAGKELELAWYGSWEQGVRGERENWKLLVGKETGIG